MFNVSAVKNTHQSNGKDEDTALCDILEVGEPGRLWPYFSIVPSQVQGDSRYQKLGRENKGHFLRLTLPLWRDGGTVLDHPKTAKSMEMTVDEWATFKNILLESGLLKVSNDGCCLVQPELRRQYLDIIRISHNKAEAKKLALNKKLTKEAAKKSGADGADIAEF